jgi:hypothetical protein
VLVGRSYHDCWLYVGDTGGCRSIAVAHNPAHSHTSHATCTMYVLFGTVKPYSHLIRASDIIIVHLRLQ